ncbi:MAG: mechanosensitive ion channel domain-containing protein [Nanoarchaeota archaeon]
MANITAVGDTLLGIQNTLQELAVGFVILLVGFGTGVLIKKLLLHALQEMRVNKAASTLNLFIDVEKITSSFISYGIYLATIIIFFDYFGIRSLVLWAVSGGIVALLLLTFIVGLKDVIPNFRGGLAIQKNGVIKEGKYIEIKELAGTVQHIGYLETKIKTESGDVLFVPNSLFLKHKAHINS